MQNYNTTQVVCYATQINSDTTAQVDANVSHVVNSDLSLRCVLLFDQAKYIGHIQCGSVGSHVQTPTLTKTSLISAISQAVMQQFITLHFHTVKPARVFCLC